MLLILKVGLEGNCLGLRPGLGSSGMMISGRGLDSVNVLEIIPSTASSSEVNEDGEFNCEISCGSDGEVANDPSTGNQFASRTV